MLERLSDENRPIRLRLWNGQKDSPSPLVVKQVVGFEAICDRLEYRLLCLSNDADLALKQFMAMPAEVQFVTSTGTARSVCGLISAAQAGESDGGMASYLITVRDALSIYELGCNTRIFRDMNEVDITAKLLGERMRENPLLSRTFNFEIWRLKSNYPRRAFTMQYNESDSAFLYRLWKRRGISWFFQPTAGRANTDAPAHTLILFDDANLLTANAAASVRYHRDDSTEQSDSITAWHAHRTLKPGNVARQSWDYKFAGMQHTRLNTISKQGTLGDQFTAALDDSLIDVQHAGHDLDDFRALGKLRILRHEFGTKCFFGEGGGREWCPGQYVTIVGHEAVDSHPVNERDFVFTELRVVSENNFSKKFGERANRLFRLNGWFGDSGRGHAFEELERACDERDGRYTASFTCVRRRIPIVPSYDPRIDLPRAGDATAIVVGPPGETVHCDDLGRVRVRFPGSRPAESLGPGMATSAITEHDSAWVPVGTGWAGNGFGFISLPRVGTAVIVSFLGGDPDKPIIVGATHTGVSTPPRFDHSSQLPAERYLSGIVSREIGGMKSNQLRMDDTAGQINVQLASDHGATALNIGYLTHPRKEGGGKARGEGFELTSNESGSIRTAKSLLISTWQRLNACGTQLSADEHLGLMQDCAALFKSLGDVAFENHGLASDSAAHTELKEDIKAAAGGSNVEPNGIGGKPTLSLSAAAGVAMTTPKTIVSYAGVNVDSVAQQHMQFSSGQCFNLNAGKGISLFSHHDGIRAIAHYGKFIMHSQHDDTEIVSAKNVTITATDGIISLMAKEIRLIAEDGSFTKIGNGITHGTNGDIKSQAANFPFSGPATMQSAFPAFGDSSADQQFVLKYGAHLDNAPVAPNRRFEIKMSDGSIVKGMSDAMGKTGILQREAMHIAHIKVLADETE